MNTAIDNYPSRLGDKGAFLPRKDPVVAASPYRDDGPLDSGQLGAYEKEGYLYLEGFYAQEAVTQFRDEMERLRFEEQVRQSELAVTEPTSGEVRSIFAVHTVSPIFAALACDERLLGIARQILGSDVYLHQSRMNFKPGFQGREFYWHSDFETWHAEDGLPGMRTVSFSVALTDNYPFNGPLMLLPGSHRYFVQCEGPTPSNHYLSSLKKQDCGVPSNDMLAAMAEKHGIEMPCGAAGSVLFFDCNLMHGSNGNITPYPRSNVFFVYNSIENTLQEPFAAAEARPWYLGNREPEALVSEPLIFPTQPAVAEVG